MRLTITIDIPPTSADLDELRLDTPSLVTAEAQVSVSYVYTDTKDRETLLRQFVEDQNLQEGEYSVEDSQD